MNINRASKQFTQSRRESEDERLNMNHRGIMGSHDSSEMQQLSSIFYYYLYVGRSFGYLFGDNEYEYKCDIYNRL